MTFIDHSTYPKPSLSLYLYSPSLFSLSFFLSPSSQPFSPSLSLFLLLSRVLSFPQSVSPSQFFSYPLSPTPPFLSHPFPFSLVLSLIFALSLIPGKSIPRYMSESGKVLPSAREVSMKCFQPSDEKLDVDLSQMFMQFGQFIDHDIILTELEMGEDSH